MGTGSGTTGANVDAVPDPSKVSSTVYQILFVSITNIFASQDAKLSVFSSWFTWCQTCRHGGHAGHVIEWFLEHVECPVTGCTCKCAQLDSGL